MSPRFSCRLFRFRCSPQGDAPMSGHAAQCPDCRAWWVTAVALDRDLRRDATAARPPAPTHLERDILRAVRVATASPAPVARRWIPAAFTISAVGALACVAVILTLRSTHDTPASAPMHAPLTHIARTEASTPTNVPPETMALVATVETLSAKLTQEVLPTTGTLIAHNPMQEELAAVYSDARSALDFLALNFLPRESI